MKECKRVRPPLYEGRLLSAHLSENSIEASKPRPPRLRRQRHRRLERGLELEQARRGGEVVEAVEAPGVGAFGRDLALSAGQEEVCGGAAARGLDLDQALAARRVEAADVVTGAVAALLGRPFDLARQVGAVVSDQEGAFVVEDVVLAQMAQGAVAVVAGGGVVFTDDAGETLGPGLARQAEGRRGGDGEDGGRRRVRLAPWRGEGPGGFVN